MFKVSVYLTSFWNKDKLKRDIWRNGVLPIDNDQKDNELETKDWHAMIKTKLNEGEHSCQLTALHCNAQFFPLKV